MSGPADRLLELMYEWMDEAEKCSSNLRGLAQELESLREKCNAVETVSSTTAVAGTVLSILAAPFTGGASLLVGAVAGGLGAGVSVVTKLIEKFESSDKLERVKEIDRKCNKITVKIKHHFQKLRMESPSSSKDERDKHVVKEFLKAMLRKMRLTDGLDINNLDRFVRDVMEELLSKSFTESALNLLVIEVIGVLTLFSLKLGGSVLPTIAAAGGIQIGKAVIGAGASAVFLGLVGLGINLYESISNWRELIKNKHETDASKSLRNTAEKIDKAKTDLSNKFLKIKKMLREALKKHSTKRRPPPDPPSDNEEISSCETESSSETESGSETSSDEALTRSQTWNKSRKAIEIHCPETLLSKTFSNLHLHKSDPPKTVQTSSRNTMSSLNFFQFEDSSEEEFVPSFPLPSYPQSGFAKFNDEPRRMLSVSRNTIRSLNENPFKDLPSYQLPSYPQSSAKLDTMPSVPRNRCTWGPITPPNIVTSRYDLASQINNQSVRPKTTPTNKSNGSKSSNNSLQIPWSKFSSSSGRNSRYTPRDQDKESSSESCSESESSSDSESCSDSESSSESESGSEVEVELKMALVNARSVNKFVVRKDRALIELIQENHLDVLLITETWLKMESLTNDTVRSILPPNYNIFNVPRAFGRGGGVAIVHRRDLECEQIHFEPTVTFEYVATAVSTPGSSEPLLVLNIYRPPGGSTKEFSRDFLIEFHLLMCDVYARFQKVVIGGDFNLWVDSPDRKARVFEEITRENDLVQCVPLPTHSRGHTLDLVFAKSNVRVSDVSVKNNTFSDHSTVIFRAKLRMKKNKRKQEKSKRKHF